MSCNWKTEKLGNLLELIIDHRGKTPKKMGFEDFHSQGYPVLSAKHVKTEGLANLDALRFANEAMYKKWMKEEVRDGDIILTSEAPLGELFYIFGDRKYLLGQRVFGLRPKKELINPLYLFSWLASKNGQDALSAKATGSTVQGIKQSELLTIDIDLPPKDVQDFVADMSFCLANKIGINRQINQTLEQIAQALFKSWFVDFEPVKAKIAVLEAGGSQEEATFAAMTAISGKDTDSLAVFAHEHPEQYAELKATAELFPSAMQESGLGEIPEGWSVERIGNLLELAYGKALKSTNRKEGSVPVYGSGGITGFHNEPLIPHGSIIVGRKDTVGSLFWEDDPFFAIDTTYYVRPLTIPLTYCYYAMQTLRLEKMNTDAAVPGLNRENVYRLELTRPTTCVLEKFDLEISLLRKAIRANSNASKTLASLRDTLIPKLLSGKLRTQGD
ncbi:restriction endonuclease subunit S [Yersinia aldovae]|uniref:restriction endonuclease subunit S n=1 Tax=Yersinia aldovae TaxID=29483 RepID=UPI00119D6421|nr:restriction endonuclease subunit S [Yersinia aldovae]